MPSFSAVKKFYLRKEVKKQKTHAKNNNVVKGCYMYKYIIPQHIVVSQEMFV